MRFVKAHGLGNDFVIFDDRGEALSGLNALSARVCDRRTGIGGDGMMLVRSSKVADVRMLIFNSDGSEAEMCGNGIRCFSKFVFDKGIVPLKRFYVETLAGVMDVALEAENGRAGAITVGMGRPEFACEKIPVSGTGTCELQTLTVLGRSFTFSAVLLGVPHVVVFVDDLEATDLQTYGPAIEKHPLFPKGANVNFTQVLGKDRIAVRTWERGCGATLACGTGASSAAVCSALAGYTGREVTVELALGMLNISWNTDGAVFMRGPAELVFEGELDLEKFV